MPVLTDVQEHPCFGSGAHHRFGRIHLPVAPRCNLRCAYCDRRCDCPNESRPGVASALITPAEAAERTARALRREPRIRVAGIAGPGEPLANPETFETLRLLHTAFPPLILCVSTNGLLLCDLLDRLLCCGVRTLTVTVNAVSLKTAVQIYSRTDPGLFLERQRRGLEQAVQAGLTVKVNTVLIPGVNDAEIPEVARLAADAGAAVMNIMPLIPCGGMSDRPPPTPEQLAGARRCAGKFLPQFMECKQCRADACGVPGLE